MSYVTAVGLLAIDVRDGTSLLLIHHLEGAFSARAWTKSDIDPRCPDWACLANIRLRQTPISGFCQDSCARVRHITCSQPNEQSN